MAHSISDLATKLVSYFAHNGFAVPVTGDVTGDVTGEITAAQFATDATGVGFFTEAGTPIAQPNVPLTTPSVQDVIDALIALGLVEQSD
jgi:hypothetical protein